MLRVTVHYVVKKGRFVKPMAKLPDFGSNGGINLVPRLNRIGTTVVLEANFPDHSNFIKQIFEKALILQSVATLLLQSLSMTEKRLFAIITSLIPTFNGKRGVILSHNELELESLTNTMHALYPRLKIKFLTQNEMIQYQHGEEIPDALKEYEILLCKPIIFQCLRYDFKKLSTNIGAICFHDVIPSHWYYFEIFALAQRLKRMKYVPHLYFSSSSNLPHIQATLSGEMYKSCDLPAFRNDVYYYNLVLPMKAVELKHLHLKNSLNLLHRFEPSITYNNSEEETTPNDAKMLVILHERDEDAFSEVFPGSNSNQIQIKSVKNYLRKIEKEASGEEENSWDGDELEKITEDEEEEFDIILIEDIILKPNLLERVDGLIEYIEQALSHLKHGGKVIFFSPPWFSKWAANTYMMLSGFFPLQFNWWQKRAIIQFVLFHDRLTKNEIKNFFQCSLTPNTSKELEFLLKDLKNPKGITFVKESQRRYTCTDEGETLVRYQQYLLYEIHSYIREKKIHVPGETHRVFKSKAVIAKDLASSFMDCPCIINLPDLLQRMLTHMKDMETYPDENPEKYRLSEYILAKIDPIYSEYNPFYDIEEKALDSREDPSKYRKETPYIRRKPVGQTYLKNRQCDAELKTKLLKKLSVHWNDTHTPMHWLNLIGGITMQTETRRIKLSESKGFRLIQEFIEAKVIRDAKIKVGMKKHKKPRFLDPKYLDVEENKMDFRGRPPKNLVPYDFDLPSLQMNRCGDCYMFTRTNRCKLINDLLKWGKPESIPHLRIRELISHKNINANLQIHPRMIGCEYFQRKIRDFELKSYSPTTMYQRVDKTLTQLELYECKSKGCTGVMEYIPHRRSYK
ncbi:MAG TPA: hypothetical protein VMV49_07620, partial [Candidatus Deferrimicrobium sp.]|nr:hypothetical protein [Candidatus Deferrimicrobium sp.]